MLSIRSTVDERIEKLYGVAIFDLVILLAFIVLNIFHPVRSESILRDYIQDFNFIISCFDVVRRTLLDFQSHIAAVMSVTSQPDSREVTPA